MPKTTVKLISWTQLPVETIYCEWLSSRTDDEVPSIWSVKQRELQDSAFAGEVRKVFEDCVSMKVPIAETINFVFLIDHMPVALREQLVRHRIGHKYVGDFGFEQVPNIADSSWWSQTMRAKDMGSFATDNEYLVPEWLEKNGSRPMPNSGKTISEWWREQHLWLQAAYRRLVDAGMPLEDARNLLPLGCQHRMAWSCNLSALQHILSKRSCWIAQLGMWEPVVFGLVEELSRKVDPFFHNLVNPPCISGDKFSGCHFHKENKEYILGRDPHHPCPLWLHNHSDIAVQAVDEAPYPTWKPVESDAAMLNDSDGDGWAPARPNVCGSLEEERRDFKARSDKYVKLWGRSATTGERIELV